MSGDKDVTDVLVRSREIPNLPFKGNLKYEGVQIVLSVIAKYARISFSDSVFLDKDIADSEMPTVKGVKVERSSNSINKNKIESNPDIATSVSEMIQNNSDNADDKNWILYETNDQVYVAELGFRYVFNIVPEETHISVTARSNTEFTEIPDTPNQLNMNGEFSDYDSDEYRDGRSLIEFKKSSRIIELFFNRYSTTLEITDVENTYDVYELKQNQKVEIEDKPEEVSEYCSATVTVHTGEYVIKCDSNDGPVTFRIPLTKFNTLPEWANNRLNVDKLLTSFKSEDSMLVEIKDSDASSDSKWVSEMGHKEFIGVK